MKTDPKVNRNSITKAPRKRISPKSINLRQLANAVCVFTVVIFSIELHAQSSPSCPWVGSNAAPDLKAQEVVAQMTLAEKLTLMYPSLSNFGTYQQATAPIPSLCVPSMILQGGIAGVRATPAGTATQLPSPINMAATFDVEAAYQYGRLEGNEAWVKGIQGLQAPFVNIARVPQWGRDSETWGEDPYLTAVLGRAVVSGMQHEGVFSVVQSYAAYTQETNRGTSLDDDIIADNVLREIYMLPLEPLIEGYNPIGGAMCTYPQINGVYSCQSPYMNIGIIDNEWGFKGFIRTDAGAAPDQVGAINAGTDFLNPFTLATVTTAVNNGQIPILTINEAVQRILTQMFRWGVFDRVTPTAATAATWAATPASTPEHVLMARKMAEEGTVLLKNSGSILPISREKINSIVIIGADGGTGADTAATGSAAVAQLTSNIITPLQGIQAAAGPGVAVTYNDGSSLTSASSAASQADVAVVFVNQPAGEGTDLTTLELPNGQDSLVEAVATANPKTVVVINSANPVLMPWLGQVPGVLDAWFPGQEDGNAIAALLFGDVNPSGKLPMTFPTSDTASPVGTPAQWPGVNGEVQFSEGLNVGYRGYEALGITPLFPFGFGLSYTTFSISDLEVTPNVSDGRHPIFVQFTVKNTGTRFGAEVPQLYIGLPNSAGEPPKRLVGFEKVRLEPRQKVRVQLVIDPNALTHPLSYWNSQTSSWSISDGIYKIYVGNSAEDISLFGSILVGPGRGH